jgi:hypothetical protein
MAIKKCTSEWLGVIYDSQVTNRKQGRAPCESPSPARIHIGRLGVLGVIYDYQPAEMHNKTTTSRWKLLLLKNRV